MTTSQKNGGTRSGLLWEVERILTELFERERENLPQILLMENVPEVCGSSNLKDFIKWQNRLEEFGYKNYVEILNSKNYGIPQNRRRCFMVSILGDYSYEFPIKIKLKYELKDLLEKKCDEKYYLSKKQIERISKWKSRQKPLDNAKQIQKNGVVPTLTARGAGEEHGGMILIDEDLFDDNEVVDFSSSDAFLSEHKGTIAPTQTTHQKFAIVEKGYPKDNGGGLLIVEDTKKGYKVAQLGDGVDIGGRMKNHRGTVQKGLSLTLKTSIDVGVVVEDEEK